MQQGELGAKARNGPAVPTPAWSGPFAVSRPSTLEKIFALREWVWRNESSLVDVHSYDPSATMLRDAHDAHGLHWIITVEDAIVAAARLCTHHHASDLPHWDGYHELTAGLPGPFASLNRLVVHPSMRRQGLSRILTDVRIQAARSKGVRSILVEAAPNRVPPLHELGFVERGRSAGEPWELVPFTLMVLDLSA